MAAGLATHAQTAEAPMAQVVENGLKRATSQSLLLAEALKDKKDALPRTFEKGRLQTIRYDHWVSGFFPGVLWMLYENNNDEKLRRYAEMYTDRVEPAKRVTNTHDLGFMLYCSFGQGYRLTGNKHYLDVISEGTQSLLTRWNDKLGVIKSWESGPKWQYPVIIDNMMNLEMLCFMTRETGDRSYERIAERHANTTMKNHFREDYSTFHVVSYDTITGQPHAKNTHQGYADGSSWSRGQAWGLYGYTMMYRETLNPRYLKQAQEIGKFLMNHPRLPKDKVPYWDYDAPDIPNAKRDASAAAVMASALIELSQLDPSELAPQWLALAEQQLRTLSSPTYLAEEGQQGGFIIKHGVGHHPAGAEIDVPLTYGDYYYVEALMRMKKLLESPQASLRELWIENGSRRIFGELFTPAQNAQKRNAQRPIAIIAHGFNGTFDYGRNYFKTMESLGYDCYTFDFPCGSVRSRSDNNTLNMSILDEVSDLKAIVAHFRKQGHRHIVLIGESQGGLVSALTAADLKEKVSQLVLVFPALCIPDNWRQRYPRLEDIQDVTELWGVKMGRRFFEEIHDMRSLDLIGKYRGPVLIVQGDADRVVSMDDSRRAQQLYRPGTRLHVIPGAGHGFKPHEFQEEMEQLQQFLKK